MFLRYSHSNALPLQKKETCYTYEMPVMVRVLYMWPPVGSILLGSFGNFRQDPQRKILRACFSQSLLSLSTSFLLCFEQLSSAKHSYLHNFLNKHTRLKTSQTDPSEPLSQNKPFHFKSHTKELEDLLRCCDTYV